VNRGFALPEGRAGQALALGLLLLAMALLWLGVAAPLLDEHAQAAERITRKATVGSRMANLVATLPELRRAAEATPGRGTRAGLLDGPTDALAGATLQQLVQSLARQQPDVALSSLETLPTETVGSYRRIGLRVVGTAPWPQLLGLLLALEQAEPSLAVDALSLRAPPVQLTRAGARLPIDLGFTVFAFRKAEG
jgi:general secretion pathway protein M